MRRTYPKQMKIQLLSRSALLAASLSLAACSSTPKGDTATTTDTKAPAAAMAGSMTVPMDTNASHVKFTGNGVGKNHPGTFKLSQGEIMLKDSKPTGGEFTINMTSLDLLQRDEMFQTKLKGHLMSPDFFDIAKYPTSKFVITKVDAYTADPAHPSATTDANYTISGNLTLKGITKNITFPAHIAMDGAKLVAQANFNIQRGDWNIIYNNDKTSNGDKFIQPDVNIELDIKS